MMSAIVIMFFFYQYQIVASTDKVIKRRHTATTVVSAKCITKSRCVGVRVLRIDSVLFSMSRWTDSTPTYRENLSLFLSHVLTNSINAVYCFCLPVQACPVYEWVGVAHLRMHTRNCVCVCVRCEYNRSLSSFLSASYNNNIIGSACCCSVEQRTLVTAAAPHTCIVCVCVCFILSLSVLQYKYWFCRLLQCWTAYLINTCFR